METCEGFTPSIDIEKKSFEPSTPTNQTDQLNNQEKDLPLYPTHREICQQLIQNPNSSHLFEKYQVEFNPSKKLPSLFELKIAMMSKYGVKESSPSNWEQASAYEDYTGLSAETARNFEVLSEYIGLEQAIIITETHLPDPFTQTPSVEALKKYIIFRLGKYIDTPQKIEKFIAHQPPDSEETRAAKNIDKIGGFCDASKKTVVVSPSTTNQKDHLFTLAHETYHFSQKERIAFSKHKIKLFNERDFTYEEEFEANLYAFLYDPSPFEFNNPDISEPNKLFLTVNTLLSLTDESVVNKLGQLSRRLDKIFNQSQKNSEPKT